MTPEELKKFVIVDGGFQAQQAKEHEIIDEEVHR